MADKINTTHKLMDRKLILYRRERSSVWQCRFKVGGIWQRKSTKEHDFDAANEVAQRLLIEAEIRKKSNLPILTRRYRNQNQFSELLLSLIHDTNLKKLYVDTWVSIQNGTST